MMNVRYVSPVPFPHRVGWEHLGAFRCGAFHECEDREQQYTSNIIMIINIQTI